MKRAWLAVGLMLAGCSSKTSQLEHPRLPEEPGAPLPTPVAPPPKATSDYATLRSTFKTILIRSGPSPQPWKKPTLREDAEEITFESGGLKLQAWISRGASKPTPTRRPAVLFLHSGFGFSAEDWDATKPFRDAGYIVMTPILRGENGQPGHFTLFYDEVDDVLAAAEILVAAPAVDSTKIFVVGHSAGGTLAMFAAMSSKRFRAAVSMSGSPDVQIFPNSMLPFDRERTQEIAMRSPLAFATSFLCRTRLYFGDEELFRDSTLETARRAAGAGLDVTAQEVAGDHLTMTANAIPLAIAFFKEK